MISRFISADLEVLAVSPSREAGDRGELSEKAEWMPIPEMILNLVLSFIVEIQHFFFRFYANVFSNFLFIKTTNVKGKTRQSKLGSF